MYFTVLTKLPLYYCFGSIVRETLFSPGPLVRETRDLQVAPPLVMPLAPDSRRLHLPRPPDSRRLHRQKMDGDPPPATPAGGGLTMAHDGWPGTAACGGLGTAAGGGLAMAGDVVLAAADHAGQPALESDGVEAVASQSAVEAEVADALAVARSLLPTIHHPAIEYNLPVMDVQRYCLGSCSFTSSLI